MTRLFVLDEVERMMKIETIILKAIAGEMAWNQAAELLDLSPRQLRRKRKTYDEEGLNSLIDRRKGRSKKRKPKALIERILVLYKEEYWGFNVSHFHEELLDTTDINVSYTWLKTLLQDKGYVKKEAKRGRYRRRRERRPMTGMLIHIDGSFHRWFAHKCDEKQTLVLAMDDADSRILSAQFVKAESTHSVLSCLQKVVLENGTFISLYTDRAMHFVYTPTANGKPDRSKPTQVELVLKELGIELICAYSPQARGRGERKFRTLQDRLVNELKREKITTYEEANRYLEEVYIPKHNARFSVSPKSKETAFIPTKINLKRIFSKRYERTVRKDNTVSLDNQVYQLPRPKRGRTMAGRKIEMRVCLDGTVIGMHAGRVIFECHARLRLAANENDEEVKPDISLAN